MTAKERRRSLDEKRARRSDDAMAAEAGVAA